MQEFVTFILILIGWHSDHPGEFEIKRIPSVFASEAECNLHGNEAVEQRKIYKFEFGGVNYVYKCIPSASNAETTRALTEAEEDAAAQQAEQK
jgi:hypothetical protein